MTGPLSRRKFLESAGLLAAVACALPWGAALAQLPQQPDDKKKKKKKREPQPEDDPRYDCGKYWVAELGPTRSYSADYPCLVQAEFKDYFGVVMEKEKVYVRWERLDPKTRRWIVLSSVCTHLKCRVDYDPEVDHFVCPCHHSEFDLEGEVLHKPAKKPLPDYSDLLLNEEGQLFLRRIATRKSVPPEEPAEPQQ